MYLWIGWKTTGFGQTSHRPRACPCSRRGHVTDTPVGLRMVSHGGQPGWDTAQGGEHHSHDPTQPPLAIQAPLSPKPLWP